MPAIDRLADLEEHLLQGVGLRDAVPAVEGRSNDDCFEAERIEKARKVLERKDTVAVLCVSEISTIILHPQREKISSCEELFLDLHRDSNMGLRCSFLYLLLM